MSGLRCRLMTGLLDKIAATEAPPQHRKFRNLAVFFTFTKQYVNKATAVNCGWCVAISNKTDGTFRGKGMRHTK